jgi:hypothetical protein
MVSGTPVLLTYSGIILLDTRVAGDKIRIEYIKAMNIVGE